MVITGLLFSQVKKAVGGQARGMALYEDDVRPSHGSHTTVYKILYRMTFLLHIWQLKITSLVCVYVEKKKMKLLIMTYLCKSKFFNCQQIS